MPPTKRFSPDGRNTYVAAAAITKGQALMFGAADGTVEPCAAATDPAIGIATDDAAPGEETAVFILGAGNGTYTSFAADALGAGDLVNALRGPAASGDTVIGRALTPALANEPFELGHTTAYAL